MTAAAQHAAVWLLASTIVFIIGGGIASAIVATISTLLSSAIKTYHNGTSCYNATFSYTGQIIYYYEVAG